MSDRQLIQQTVAGDRDAFGELVRRYQQRLYNSLAHLLGDDDEAEDAVQEAFLLAFAKLGSFRQESSFYTWLYRVAFNAAISRLRKKRAPVSLHQDIASAGGLPDDSESPSDRLDRTENIQIIHDALGQLSEPYRAILVLREIDGLSYEEVSDILDLPIGTVRSRLHRARGQLKVELETLLNRDSSTPTTR